MWQLMVFFLAVALLVVTVLLYHEIQFVDDEEMDDSNDSEQPPDPDEVSVPDSVYEDRNREWYFCTIVIDPDAPADVYSQAQLPLSEQIVIEQNELGEYRTRPLLDVIDTESE